MLLRVKGLDFKLINILLRIELFTTKIKCSKEAERGNVPNIRALFVFNCEADVRHKRRVTKDHTMSYNKANQKMNTHTAYWLFMIN